MFRVIRRPETIIANEQEWWFRTAESANSIANEIRGKMEDEQVKLNLTDGRRRA